MANKVVREPQRQSSVGKGYSESDARERVMSALASLDREVHRTEPAGSTGPLESPLLAAIANATIAYVRWRLASEDSA